MDLEIRTVTEKEFPLWAHSSARGFGAHANDESVEVDRSHAELDRTFAAFHGGSIVGTSTTRSLSLTTPGNQASLGFIDDVTVQPTHRRRGILTRIMKEQLSHIHERGEPFAMLSASESLIYERFGFGIATWAEMWRIQRQHTAFRSEPDAGGTLNFVDAESALKDWPKLFSKVAAVRNGMVHYGNPYWKAAMWDSEYQRRGASKLFHVAYLRDGDLAGTLSYRLRDGKVLVMHLLGTDDEIEAELWNYCFGIDLMTETVGFNRAPDDPLIWRLVDPRRLERSVRDHMWLRLIDVPQALSLRQYNVERRITFRVRDPFCEWNNGTYTLEAGPDGAECSVTNGAPDIELTEAELASVFLGGNSFESLVRSGRISGRSDGAIRRADAMFRTERLPWSVEL